MVHDWAGVLRFDLLSSLMEPGSAGWSRHLADGRQMADTVVSVVDDTECVDVLPLLRMKQGSSRRSHPWIHAATLVWVVVHHLLTIRCGV